MAIISFKTSCRICNYIRWKDIKGWTNGDDDDIDHNPPTPFSALLKIRNQGHCGTLLIIINVLFFRGRPRGVCAVC